MSSYHDTRASKLPARGVTSLTSDVDVVVVDMVPVGASRQSQLEISRRQLAERKNAQPVTQLEDSDDDDVPQNSASLTRFTVRDAEGTMRYLIFHDQQPAIELGGELLIKKGCEIHRDVLVAMYNGVVVKSRGKEMSLEQRIWRLERP